MRIPVQPCIINGNGSNVTAYDLYLSKNLNINTTTTINRLVVIIGRKRATQELVVNKTVSLPLSIVNEILNESEVMGKDFSGTLVTLLRIGLSVRKDQQLRAAEEVEREVKRLSGRA